MNDYLSRELCTPFGENISHNAQIKKHFTTKLEIESVWLSYKIINAAKSI